MSMLASSYEGCPRTVMECVLHILIFHLHTPTLLIDALVSDWMHKALQVLALLAATQLEAFLRQDDCRSPS